jgi:hypothetical protein
MVINFKIRYIKIKQTLTRYKERKCLVFVCMSILRKKESYKIVVVSRRHKNRGNGAAFPIVGKQ